MKRNLVQKSIRSMLAPIVLVFILSSQLEAQQKPIREGVRPDEMANLVLKALTLSPTYPMPGEHVDIEVEVHNRATSAVRNVAVVVFAGNNQVAKTRINIEASGTASVHVPWTAPQVGSHSLSAVVDPDQEYTEQERLDNLVSLDIVVAPQPAREADFAVSDLQVVSLPEQPTLLRATIRNSGTVGAQAPLVLRSDGQMVGIRLVGPVAPGGSVTVDVPWGKQAAPSWVSAEINPRYRNDEKNPEDNFLKRDLRSSVDLSIEGLSVNTVQLEQRRFRQVTISLRVVNLGAKAVTTPFRTSVFPGFIKPDVDRPSLDTFYVLSDGLAAGQTVYISRSIVLPSDIREFEIRVEVDADHVITEADETNNIATSLYKNPVPDIGRWVSIGPTRITGSAALGYAWNDATGVLSAIAVHPTATTTILVGGWSAGVWKTTDGGTSWQPIADSLPTLVISALAIDPSAPSRVYVATKSDGVFRSEDAGISWSQISVANLNANTPGGVLLIDPSNSNVLYLASGDGVYRSSDAGATWGLSKGGGSVTGLVMDPSIPSSLYAALFHGSSDSIAGIYHTTDGGATWTKLQGCPGGTLPVNNANTKITLAVSGAQLYAGYKTSSSFQIFRTKGNGCTIGGVPEKSWESTGWSPTDPGVFWSGMWVDPTNPKNVYLGGTYFWRSTDAGGTFEQTSGLGSPANSAHVDHHAFSTDPLSPNIIYSLNDGGIYRSLDRGNSGTWTFLGDGITNVEFYDHAAATTDPSVVIGGTQDNGTIKYDGSNTVWKHIRGGDGGTVDIDPMSAKTLYSMGQYASSIAQSVTSGEIWTGIANGLPTGATCFNLHYQVHPGIVSTLLASCMSMWRTTMPGSPWSTIFTPSSGTIVRSAVDPTVDLYYAGSTNGRLDAAPAGLSWQTVFTHPANAGVTDIEVDLGDPVTVYVSFGGTGSGRIYRLRRSSRAPTTMTAVDITSDLPSGLRVRTLAVDRMAPLTIYAGTTKGVYRGRSADGGTTWWWRAYNNGLPSAVDIRDLEVHPITGVMRAATFGRSAFEVSTDFPIGSILAAEGKVTLLRVHDVGTRYGPPTDQIDVEVVVWLDSQPGKAFGFQLRNDANEGARLGMLELLRNAFSHNRRVRIDYTRTGFRNGLILRVMNIP